MIDVSDFHKLAADMERGSAELEPKAKVVVRKSTADTGRGAKARCPVDDGDLLASITVNVTGLTGTVTAGTDHAEYVEDGTSVMAPEPFMGPALMSNTPGFVAGFEHIAGTIL